MSRLDGALRRARLGIVLVMAGLLAQAAAGFFWSPGAFVLSAALGVPLVVVGGLLAIVGLTRHRRAPTDGAAGDAPREETK